MPRAASKSQQKPSMMIRNSHFDLNDTKAYAVWREKKIAFAPRSLEELTVKIKDWRLPSKSEITSMAAICQKSNFAIYKVSDNLCRGDILALAACFGLKNLESSLLNNQEGIAELTTDRMGPTQGMRYIPYSNKPLGWHTDGYYNPTGKLVLGMMLHCIKPAKEGGMSQILDPDIVYIRLRDKNPEWISALMHKEVLTIPANDRDFKRIRGANTGPVFSIIDGNLAMRYTHRTRSAMWCDSPLVTEARKFLREMLEHGDEFMHSHLLSAGEGIMSNNVLHRRTGFQDSKYSGQRRLFYRARFRDRVTPIPCQGGEQ